MRITCSALSLGTTPSRSGTSVTVKLTAMRCVLSCSSRMRYCGLSIHESVPLGPLTPRKPSSNVFLSVPGISSSFAPWSIISPLSPTCLAVLYATNSTSKSNSGSSARASRSAASALKNLSLAMYLVRILLLQLASWPSCTAYSSPAMSCFSVLSRMNCSACSCSLICFARPRMLVLISVAAMLFLTESSTRASLSMSSESVISSSSASSLWPSTSLMSMSIWRSNVRLARNLRPCSTTSDSMSSSSTRSMRAPISTNPVFSSRSSVQSRSTDFMAWISWSSSLFTSMHEILMPCVCAITVMVKDPSVDLLKHDGTR
mmetsp:Transcript_48852/g.90883  ORF Transcript_48852/g.90883 Transcript_48852/m.90883 type:complete len:317 (-) Transcript_48852:949-1899(-)